MDRRARTRAIRSGSVLGAVCMAVLLLLAAPALADTITFEFESPFTPWVFNGTATQVVGDSSDPRLISGNGSVQLTDLSVSNELGKGAGGSIVLAYPISTAYFDVTFSFLIFGGEVTNPWGFVGDGITFSVFGGDSPAVVGLCCSGLGFANIVDPTIPAFSVEFDTYANEAIDVCHDTSGNEVPCTFDGPAPHVSVNLGSMGIFGQYRDQALTPVGNLRNQVYTARIQFYNSLLNVSLDGQPVITNFLVPQEFIPPMAYIGFTGSTGSYSDYQIIDKVTVTSVPEPPALSLLLIGLITGMFVLHWRAGQSWQSITTKHRNSARPR